MLKKSKQHQKKYELHLREYLLEQAAKSGAEEEKRQAGGEGGEGGLSLKRNRWRRRGGEER